MAADDPKAFLTELTEGIAAELVEYGAAGVYYWNPGSATPAGKIGVHRTITPPNLKTPSVTMTAYLDTFEVEAVVLVQFKVYAADERVGDKIEADLFSLFDERWGGKLGAVELKMAARASGTHLGQDSNGRLGRSENYAFTVYRPNPNRSS